MNLFLLIVTSWIYFYWSWHHEYISNDRDIMNIFLLIVTSWIYFYWSWHHESISTDRDIMNIFLMIVTSLIYFYWSWHHEKERREKRIKGKHTYQRLTYSVEFTEISKVCTLFKAKFLTEELLWKDFCSLSIGDDFGFEYGKEALVPLEFSKLE